MGKRNKKNNKTTMKNKTIVLVSIVGLVAIFFGLKYLYNQSQTDTSKALLEENSFLFERPYSFVEGEDSAKVQLVEFFDPACGACATFYPHVKDIFEENYGDVKIVFRYAPFHKNADFAVKVLEGAREQNLFLEVLEHMFLTQSYWVQHHVVDTELLWKSLGDVQYLNMKLLSEFMESSKANERLQQDLEDGKKLGVNKTPSYFVNGRPLQKFSLENLKELVKSELEK
ncbi:MAG: DsbA family protein [Campylobacterales bacterium]|nr:DsbA family protein [Campylobacterales bacterium]